jgi:L-ascorbate peroxidase
LGGAYLLVRRGTICDCNNCRFASRRLFSACWLLPALNPFAGIATDHVLADDPTCRPLIQRYAADQPAFFRDFAAAFEKMSCVGVQWA